MAAETYLDNKVRSSTRVKFYFAVLHKIDELGEVQDIFNQLPNSVAIKYGF